MKRVPLRSRPTIVGTAARRVIRIANHLNKKPSVSLYRYHIFVPLYVMFHMYSFCIGRVAQWIRRPTSNRKIVGSIPIVVSFLEGQDFVYSQAFAKGRLSASIVGSVVEFSPATRETGVRFPDNAGFYFLSI